VAEIGSKKESKEQLQARLKAGPRWLATRHASERLVTGQSGGGASESGPRQRRSRATGTDPEAIVRCCSCDVVDGGAVGRVIKFFFLRVYSVRSGHVGGWGQEEEIEQSDGGISHLCRNGASAAHMIKSLQSKLCVEGRALASMRLVEA
jgi:hypothetical protein